MTIDNLIDKLVRNDEYKILIDFFREKKEAILKDLIARSGSIEMSELQKANGQLEILSQLENLKENVSHGTFLKLQKIQSDENNRRLTFFRRKTNHDS